MSCGYTVENHYLGIRFENLRGRGITKENIQSGFICLLKNTRYCGFTRDFRRLMGENKQKKEKPVRRALVLWGERAGMGPERFALASQMKTAECDAMVKNA